MGRGQTITGGKREGVNPDGHLFQPLWLFLLPPVLLPFLFPSPQGPRIKHAITLYRLISSVLDEKAQIHSAESKRCCFLEECRGAGPAMVPQETFVVSERNHPPGLAHPSSHQGPSDTCESQEAKVKLCSRSLSHSQGEGRSIQGNEGRQH